MTVPENGARQIARWTHSIIWNDGKSFLRAACPACRDDAEKPVHLTVKSPWPPFEDLPQVVCPSCGTAFKPTMRQPPHEAALDLECDCYLEQNAGIDVMAEMLASVPPKATLRYMEIGCGFGFMLDYATEMLGWRSKGFDPGHSARLGRVALGVDIEHAYLERAADAGPEPYDVILCSEVIEHLSDPAPLLRTLRDALSAEGTLLITTPSAGGMRPDTQPSALLPAIGPGYHFVLFSARGLDLLLREIGFADVVVEDTGHSLRAAAAKTRLNADISRRLDRDAYATYLQRRAQSTPPDTSLGLGFRYRLMRELTNRGDFAGAKRAAEAVAEAVRLRWPVDVGNAAAMLEHLAKTPRPADIQAYRAMAPFCLCGILYFSGLLAWQADHDRERGRTFFLAAALVGEDLRAVLRRIATDDGETEELTWRARLLANHIQAWSDPLAAALAAERLLTDASPRLGEAPPAATALPMVGRIFIDLIVLGQYEAADVLARFAEDRVTAAGDDAAVEPELMALGQLSLVHRKAWWAAAAWFGRAAEAAKRSSADPWPAVCHRAEALAKSGRSADAMAALSPLLSPPADSGIRAPDERWQAKARDLIRTSRLAV